MPLSVLKLSKFHIGKFEISYDSLEMSLEALNGCFPQATEVWGFLMDEVPLYNLIRAELRNYLLTVFLIQNKSFSSLDECLYGQV